MRPDKNLIEARFKETIDAWVTDGLRPGSFVEAVLCNDLKESIACGDEGAIDNLPHIVAYLYCDCPTACWGSLDKVRRWVEWIAEPKNAAVIRTIRARKRP